MESNYVSDRRYWLTAERDRLVEEGDPDAAFLFAIVGSAVPFEDAERYGLIKPAPKTKAKAKRAS